MRRILVGVVCVIGVLTLVPVAEAQEQCVIGCAQNDCPQGYERGTQGTNPGFWDINKCEPGGCYYCTIIPLTGEDLAAEEILRTIGAASLAELPAIVEQHRDRILLSSTRGLVAVLDTGCSGARFVASVLFVSQATTEALDHLGVKDLAYFLAEPNR